VGVGWRKWGCMKSCFSFFAGLFVVLLLGGLIVGWVVHFQGTPEGQAVELQIEAKRWMRGHLSDGEAELMGFGEPEVLWGDTYRIARVRGRNAFGGPVVNDFVLQTSGQQVVYGWSLKDFIEVKKYELEKMPSEMRGQRAAELERACLALGIRDVAKP
jgi:hypothetical protein